MKEIHCVICRRAFEIKQEDAKRDSGFASYECPLCGYENTIELCDCNLNIPKEGVC